DQARSDRLDDTDQKGVREAAAPALVPPHLRFPEAEANDDGCGPEVIGLVPDIGSTNAQYGQSEAARDQPNHRRAATRLHRRLQIRRSMGFAEDANALIQEK